MSEYLRSGDTLTPLIANWSDIVIQPSLFIHLKVGQGSDIPALRADDLMKLINSTQIFEITRVKFLDESLNEM